MANEIVKINKTLLEEKLKDNEHRFKKSYMILIPCILSVLEFIITILISDISFLPGWKKYILLFIPILSLVFALIDWKRNDDCYTYKELYDDICRCTEADSNEHSFNIIVIERNPGELLLHNKVEWGLFMFPDYKVSKIPFDKNAEKKFLADRISKDIGIPKPQIAYVKDIISVKYSENDKVVKKYHFFFWKINGDNSTLIGNNSLIKKEFRNGCHTYKWMSIEKILTDKEMKEKNQDVIDVVKDML